ncbi:D-glycero-beta-D-manno-heptose 1,7-bisphosphate 7-phosphatase [Thermithiobacillus plumbiphilus]|uniref:D,D-heptose 1,7-bisphosphate phosphatase n=1 Tax=Thermithiobacillus plumbiphilus TaxID=1729899 RepID=A0ABU9D9D0_9PROT
MCELKRALFLDRDGVINKDFGHVHQLRDFEFVDGIFSLCQSFQAAGYLIVVVTNQAGIARGMYSEHDFHQLSEWMLSRFADKGVFISAVYFCPHHPSFGTSATQCTCRKPEPGMILRARTDLDLDLGNSILIGDHESDVRAAHAAGVETTVLLRAPMTAQVPSEATYIARDLDHANSILEHTCSLHVAGSPSPDIDSSQGHDESPVSAFGNGSPILRACSL